MSTTKSESTRSQLLLRDAQLEMKKEFDRRKKLRLQQVRQQSKDLAHALREKVRQEKSNNKKIHNNKKHVQLKEWKAETLSDLQELYQNCLQDVGQSHVAAAEQPDVNAILTAERIKNAATAAKRGIQATRQKKIQDDENTQQKEGPLIRKHLTRTREDIRSIFVSSLSPPLPSISKVSSMPVTEKPETRSTASEQQPSVLVLREIPSNIKIDSARNTEKKNVETSTQTEPNRFTGSVTSRRSNCTKCGFTCCCHSTSSNSNLRRRCHSESKLNESKTYHTESDGEYDSDSTWPPRTSPCTRGQSEETRRAVSDVKCYDYVNHFRNKYRKPVVITRHGPQSNEQTSQDVQADLDLAEKKAKKLKELEERARRRCAFAYRKQKLDKDFENLCKELHTISRTDRLKGGRVRPTFRQMKDIEEKRQRKMEEDFLNSQNIVPVEAIPIAAEKLNVLNVASRQRHQPATQAPTTVASRQRHQPATQAPTTVASRQRYKPATQAPTTVASWQRHKPDSQAPTTLESELQDVLNSIEERRKRILKNLEGDRSIRGVADVTDKAMKRAEKEVHFSPVQEKVPSPVQKDVHFSPVRDKIPSPIQQEVHFSPVEKESPQSTSSESQVSSAMNKVPSNRNAKVDVEVNNSTVALNVVGLKKATQNTFFKTFDGVTVTVNVKPNRSKPCKNKMCKSKTNHESSSSYYSPPENIPSSNNILIENLISRLQVKGTNHSYLKPYIIKLLNMSRESVEAISSVSNESILSVMDHESVTSTTGSTTRDNGHAEDILKTTLNCSTEKHLNKLLQFSKNFQELLSNIQEHDHDPTFSHDVPDYSVEDYPVDVSFDKHLLGVNNSYVSTVSTYLKPPDKIPKDNMPKTIPTPGDELNRPDYTLRELENLLQLQKLAIEKLPQNLLPKPPSPVKTASPGTSPAVEETSADANVPWVPTIEDIQAKFSFLELNLDSPTNTIVDDSFDIFQGLPKTEHNIKPTSPNLTKTSPVPQLISSSPKNKPPGFTASDMSTCSEVKTVQSGDKVKDVSFSSTVSTELETELEKMGLGWAGATLRKTREASKLSGSSTSTSGSKPASKTKDRHMRPSHRIRYSSPIQTQTLPFDSLNSSSDSLEFNGAQSKKYMRKTYPTVKNTNNFNLSPPKLSLKTPSLRFSSSSDSTTRI